MKVFLPDAAATVAQGRKIAATLQAGDVIALVGELGAGKTHLTQGIVEGLGCDEPVTSPTFALVQEYHGGRLPLYHFDFYRIEEEGELETLGWDDYHDGSGVIVVEWANLFTEAMGADAKWVEISHCEGGRTLEVRV